MKALNPYIYENKDHFGILGSKEGLINLAEMILLKAKLGTNISATLIDGTNKPIIIETDEDMKENLERSQK